MARGDNPYLVFLTTVVSHLSVIPVGKLLFKKGLLFEASVMTFAMICSLCYHTCETFNTTLFLSELRWHRLDNIGGIASFGIVFMHLAEFHNQAIDQLMKHFALLFAVIVQEKDPWNEKYTFYPLLGFIAVPILKHSVYHCRWPHFLWGNFRRAVFFMAIAVAFFVRGLDDDTDPYRMFHGGWHLFGGIGGYFMWCISQQTASSKSLQSSPRISAAATPTTELYYNHQSVHIGSNAGGAGAPSYAYAAEAGHHGGGGGVAFATSHHHYSSSANPNASSQLRNYYRDVYRDHQNQQGQTVGGMLSMLNETAGNNSSDHVDEGNMAELSRYR